MLKFRLVKLLNNLITLGTVSIMELESLLQTAQAAVKSAINENSFAKPKVTNFKNTHPGSLDFATETDLSVERSICKFLAKTKIPVYSEENNQNEEIGALWVLDPIDGTLNMEHGLPFYSISLALIQDGVPILGVIATPALTKTIYSGAKTLGAFKDKLPISVSSRPNKEAMIAYDGFRGSEVDTFLPRIKHVVARHRLLGTTATEMALCAEGAFDAVVTPSSKFWDLAAGVALIEAAGGIALALDGSKFPPFSDSVVAGSENTVRAIIAAIN
jgi:myo-inositol-1(or 4)-monophosphatase